MRNRKPVKKVLTFVPLEPAIALETDGLCLLDGLEKGQCRQQRWVGNAYCYYHQKLHDGLLQPSADLYPVTPLPRWGYEMRNL